MPALRLSLFAVLTALAPLVPTAAHACSCAMFPHEMAVERYAASFRGRATAVRRDGDHEVVTFAVLEVYRGLEPATRTVTVRRYAEIAPCFIPSFTVGATYRVYAERNEHGLVVHFCNPSQAVASR